MSARTCPQCGTPREPNGGPACACARRTADAVRDTRTAEAAAAEDFDLLRIRPYVSLPDAEGAEGAEVPKSSEGGPEGPELERARPTESAPTTDPGAPSTPGPSSPRATTTDSGTGTGTATSSATNPHTTPVHLTPIGTPADGTVPTPGRRRRVTLLSAVGAALAVIAVTAAATGLFSAEPDQDYALPDHRTTAPITTATTRAPSRTQATSASPKATPSPSRSAVATPTRSVLPTRTTSIAPPPPTASATGSIGTPEAPVLREGDEGPEVRELQDRLRQRYFYAGPSHGTYDVLVKDAVTRYQYAAGVRGDPQGVYGPATRRALESETEEPNGEPDREPDGN